MLRSSQERGYRGQSPLSGGLGSLPAVGGVSPQIQRTRPRAVLPPKAACDVAEASRDFFSSLLDLGRADGGRS